MRFDYIKFISDFWHKRSISLCINTIKTIGRNIDSITDINIDNQKERIKLK